jgi:hypothetical protein
MSIPEVRDPSPSSPQFQRRYQAEASRSLAATTLAGSLLGETSGDFGLHLVESRRVLLLLHSPGVGATPRSGHLANVRRLPGGTI